MDETEHQAAITLAKTSFILGMVGHMGYSIH